MAKTKELRTRVIDIKAVGKYIETLRKKRKLTRRQLAAEAGVSDEKSVDDWERRGILPNQESLISLANFLEISIDDLLEGGQAITKEELLEMYPIFQPINHKSNDVINKENAPFQYQTQLLEVNKRFKELIKRFNLNGLTRNEDLELRFLFENMCELTTYAEELNIKLSNDAYLDFIKVLNHLKNLNLKKDAFYWEVQKYIRFKRFYLLSLNLESCSLDKQGFDHQKFCLLESWEKDMLLAKFQNFDVLDNDIEQYEFSLDRYKKQHGKEFNKEEATKEVLKYLIDNGAVINSWFLSIITRKKVQKNIIDRLEELYNLCKKPIEIYYSNHETCGHETVKATIENNRWNRFLDKYFDFYYIFNDEKCTPKEIYRLLNTDSEKEIVMYFAKKHSSKEVEGVEYNHLLARAGNELRIWNKEKQKFLDNEKSIEQGLKEMPLLEEKLRSGVKTYFTNEEDEIGPKSVEELYGYICFWKHEQSYYDFLRKRNHKKTIQLRKEIDTLSLEEIRNRYFPKEVVIYE